MFSSERHDWSGKLRRMGLGICVDFQYEWILPWLCKNRPSEEIQWCYQQANKSTYAAIWRRSQDLNPVRSTMSGFLLPGEPMRTSECNISETCSLRWPHLGALSHQRSFFALLNIFWHLAVSFYWSWFLLILVLTFQNISLVPQNFYDGSFFEAPIQSSFSWIPKWHY